MSFVDSEYGWIIGYRYTGEYVWGYPIEQSVLLKTEDGGINWELVRILGDHSCSPLSVFFIDRTTGWINCIPDEDDYNGKIMKTIDGGKNWIEQIKVSHGINSIYFNNSMTGWAVGGWSSAFQVAILKTNDGGENWSPQNGGVNGLLESVFFIDSDTGWAVGTESNVLKTEDGGENWINLSEDLKFSRSNQFLSVYFTDAKRGFITGWFEFLSTKDGGENWTIDEYRETSNEDRVRGYE